MSLEMGDFTWVPLDVMSSFFGLLNRKVDRIPTDVIGKEVMNEA